MRSQRFKRAQDQLDYINHSYRFFLIAYTTTKDVSLVWEDFVEFYTFMYSSIHLLEHALAQFPNLLHFLISCVVYRKEKGIPLIRLECTPPNS
jgi:hypothetical protein